MDEKKKDAGPERVGSWKAASPTGVGVGDRSDGTAASGFIASRPSWETDDEIDEEMDGATMDGGAITTGAAPVGAMPTEDDVSGAARTASFTRSTEGAASDASAHGASWAPSSSRDSAHADAARAAFPDREREGFGLEGSNSGAEDSSRTFAGFDGERRGRDDEGGAAEKLKEKASEAQQRAADAGRQAKDRAAEAGHRAGDRVSEAGQKAGGKLAEVGHKATGKAKSQFNERKEDLASRLEGMKGQFTERAQEPTQQWVERIGERADALIDRAAQTLREKDADELLGMARSELRHRPMLYAGGMLAVGFLAARMFRAMEGSDASGS
jgi:hypothetical protein